MRRTHVASPQERPEERRPKQPVAQPHALLALQRSAGNQAVILQFFKRLGDQAFSFGAAMIETSARGLEGFNAFVQGLGKGIVSLAESLDRIPGIDIDVQPIKDSFAQVA